MDSNNQKLLENLAAEVEALNTRVTLLESQIKESEKAVDLHKGQNRVKAKSNEVISEEKILNSSTPKKSPHLSENFIGGKLLNRIGALIIIFAVAYFLKWSFDNDIIGELGRCVMGLVAGISLIVTGQMYIKKGYSMFSQGLTGAGIAIIYLSSFAAVNFYHLISPYTAFALMFITALSSGVLSAIENVPGSAVISTIGGFMVPFLMGSHSQQIIPLLSYILILDLAVLFLAYYRKWVFLDIIALVGTGIISMVAFSMDWKLWAGQAFIIAYLLLFIGVAAIYNSRTRKDNPALLLASTVFFIIISFINLFDKMNNWLGLVSIVFAAIYLGTYLFLSFKGKVTPFFKKLILFFALILALLIAPFQLDGVYCQIAWLGVAAVCLYFSYIMGSKAAFFTSLLIIAATGLSVFIINQEAYPTPVFNKTTLILLLCVVDWLGALFIGQKVYPEQKKITAGLCLIILATVFYLLNFDINNAIYHYQTNQSFVFMIPISWALVSSLVLLLGVRRDNTSIRMFSLMLFAIVIIRTLFYDLQQLDIVFKILVLLVIGLISLAISFFYQKRMKGDVL